MADRTALLAAMDALPPSAHSHARGVLAALGIDPDTPPEDVKAGLLLLRSANAIIVTPRPSGVWVATHRSEGGRASGKTPAAAVLALAARLEEQ